MTARHASRPFAAVLAAIVISAVVATSAQQPAPPADAAARQAAQAALNARPDTPGTGRFPAMKEEIPALPRHVVYRPQNLTALGAQKLGVVAWGNGGCSNDAASTRFHLLELASHGYLVLASGRILSGPGAPPQAPRAGGPGGAAPRAGGPGDAAAPRAGGPPAQGQLPAPRTLVSDLTDAVDWALAENQRAGSPYYGRIDPAQIAYSGWSCGGVQALQVAKDPRVKTLVIHNSGLLNAGPTNMTGTSVGKELLQTLRTPVIYILGGPSDIAYANGMDDFARISHVPVAVADLAVGHGGTFQEPNGGAAASVAVSWLNWQLRGDAESARRFVGDDCGLCRDSRWTLQRKQFPSTVK
jgi:dienelactone hydrolase